MVGNEKRLKYDKWFRHTLIGNRWKLLEVTKKCSVLYYHHTLQDYRIHKLFQTVTSIFQAEIFYLDLFLANRMFI